MMTGRELYKALQLHIAGHPTLDVIEALADYLAAEVACAATSAENADQILDNLARDMKKTVRVNWDYVRSIAANAGSAGSA